KIFYIKANSPKEALIKVIKENVDYNNNATAPFPLEDIIDGRCEDFTIKVNVIQKIDVSLSEDDIEDIIAHVEQEYRKIRDEKNAQAEIRQKAILLDAIKNKFSKEELLKIAED